MEKLALYAQGDKTVTEADIAAVMGDMNPNCAWTRRSDAAGEGDLVRLDREFERLWAAGTAPVFPSAEWRWRISQRASSWCGREADNGADIAATIKEAAATIAFLAGQFLSAPRWRGSRRSA